MAATGPVEALLVGKTRLAAFVITVVAVAGCSSPPGPAPASPAPALPADAIAYDDLLSADRPFPFTNTCEQLTTGTLQEMGARRVNVLQGMAGPAGCAIGIGTDELESVWVEPKPPPSPAEPRYFPLMWNGDLESTNYHRRLLLDGRYYAVETIAFLGSRPGCYLTVDTGSPSALQFRGIVPEQHALSYGELNFAYTDYEVDHAGIDRFMTENCPVVERSAVALLRDIDPAGGSLAAE